MTTSLLAERYQIGSPRLHGRHITIFDGVDVSLGGESIAIKRLHRSSDRALQNRKVAQFRAEFNARERLHHPNLLRVLNLVEEDGRHYLITEKMNGATLESCLKRMVNPPAQEFLVSCADQLLRLLEMLHGFNPPIVCRDIHPGNILIQPGGSLKLIELSLARLGVPESDSESGKSTRFRAVGRPGYAPLEQFSVARTTPLVDIYALGATLYTIATLKTPPPAPDRATRDAQVEVIDNPTLPREFKRQIHRMLALRIEERTQSVALARTLMAPWLQDARPFCVSLPLLETAMADDRREAVSQT